MSTHAKRQVLFRFLSFVPLRMRPHLKTAGALLALLLTPFAADAQGLRPKGLPGKPNVTQSNNGSTPNRSITTVFGGANGQLPGVTTSPSGAISGVGRVGSWGTGSSNNSMIFVNGPSPQIPNMNGPGIGFDTRYVFHSSFGGMPIGFGQYQWLANGGTYPGAEGVYFFRYGNYSSLNSPLPPVMTYYMWPISAPFGYSDSSIPVYQP